MQASASYIKKLADHCTVDVLETAGVRRDRSAPCTAFAQARRTPVACAIQSVAGVPMHMAATVLFPGGRRGTLQCGE